MELLAAFILSLVVATSGGFFPESKDSNQSEEVKVIQTKEVEPLVAEIKPEPIQKEEVKPELTQKETSWFNIILYALGAFAVAAVGIYFFTRGKTLPPANQVGTRKQEYNEGRIPAEQEQQEAQEEIKSEPQEQQEAQEEIKSEPQEQQETQEENRTVETTEDNSSDSNNK